MADAKISALTSLAGSGADIAADVVPVVDDSVTATKKIVLSNLLGAAFTTAGDIFQASAAGVAARLGLGTARQVPTVNSGATALAYQNPITLATEQSALGTAVDFTGIPAGVRRITVMFSGVSSDGVSPYLVQLGDAGGPETTGYVTGTMTLSAQAYSTAGFILHSAAAVARTYQGQLILTLENASTNNWVGSGSLIADASQTQVGSFAGVKALSATLTQVRITTVNGSDQFDAGVINICYE